MSAYPRKILASILLLALCLPLLGGCGFNKTNEKGQTLWVLTEQSTSDGMNLQAEIIAERLMEAHPGLTVQIEILPNDSQRRELALQEVRARIMAGKGPDVYLLPTGNQIILDLLSHLARETRRLEIEPLLTDVAQSMRGGLFADITSYYDGDQALKTGGLRPELMAAGVVDGKRYVLPLRFTMPVILTVPDDWSENGIDGTQMGSGGTALALTALARGNDRVLAGLCLPDKLSAFSASFDYDVEEMRITADEIADYMRLFQNWRAIHVRAENEILDDYERIYWQTRAENSNGEYATGQEMKEYITRFARLTVHERSALNRIRDYAGNDPGYWHDVGWPLFTAPLAECIYTLAIAENAGDDIQMYPMRTTDGSISADITYYGAVGSNCQNIEIAYEFLRQFLEEEFQWETYRPRVRAKSITAVEVQARGLIENSWPVRMQGSAPYLWDTIKYQNMDIKDTYYEDAAKIGRQIQKVVLTDEDVPALSWPIDRVRFPVTLPEEESFEHALSLLNEEDGTPTDVDIDALAQQVYQSLWFHLLEG